jgi:hypothetical protein
MRGIVEFMDRKAYSHILVLGDIDVALINVATLETMGLEIDLVTGKLKGSHDIHTLNQGAQGHCENVTSRNTLYHSYIGTVEYLSLSYKDSLIRLCKTRRSLALA